MEIATILLAIKNVLSHCEYILEIITHLSFTYLLGGVEFAINHPIASCVGHFIVTSSGSMVANLLLGNTLLISVTLPHVIIAFIVW